MADWLQIPDLPIWKPVKPEVPLNIRVQRLQKIAPFYIAVGVVTYLAWRAA